MRSSNQLKKENLKTSISKYILPLYTIMLIIVLAINSSYDVEDASMFAGLSHSLNVFMVVFVTSIILAIIAIILTFKNIKNNYKNTKKSSSDKAFISMLETFLSFRIIEKIIFYFIMLIFMKNKESDNVYILYYLELILMPIVIPLCKFFNKDNFISQKDIKNNILIMFLIIIILVSNLIEKYIMCVFMLPFLVCGLVDDHNKSKKVNKNDIINVIVLFLISMIVTFIKIFI